MGEGNSASVRAVVNGAASVSAVPASIPGASKKGAHSNHYDHTFYGIVNRKGEIWTPLIFGTRKEAEEYRAASAARHGLKFARIPLTHKIVPVEFRIEPDPKGCAHNQSEAS